MKRTYGPAAGPYIVGRLESVSSLGRRRPRGSWVTFVAMERLRLLARRFALEILIVILVVESAVEVALWHHDQYQSRPAWIAVPAIALVVVPLLGRRRFPFYAPAAVWLLAVAVSFADGWLVVTPVSTFLAANIAAFLLGKRR